MIRFLLLFSISFSVYASDRYQNILHNLSVDYHISYTENKNVIAQLSSTRKIIRLNRNYMDKLSENEVAWVLAHEIGHTNSMMVRNYHEDEYRADRVALSIVSYAGYSFTEKDMSSIGNKLGMDFNRDIITHPSWNKRMDKLFNKNLRMVEKNGEVLIDDIGDKRR